MVRRARIVVPGLPHHITQRGNNKQDVFFTEEDRSYYLKLLQEKSEQYGFLVQGYCLMTNHVHIIGTPKTKQSLSKTIGRTNYQYTQYINKLHNRSGHLWQSRYYSCILDENHNKEALRYVELNPVKTAITKTPWEYQWSSCKAHIGEVETTLLEMSNFKTEEEFKNWKLYLLEKQNLKKLKQIKLHLQTGRPLGTDSFLSKLEAKLNMRLRPLPIGRPRKKAISDD